MSNTSYKQIIPATDWYFRHDNVSGVAGKSTVYQLAAWALKENYCTLRLFFDLSTLAGLSRRNLPEAGIRLLFQI